MIWAWWWIRDQTLSGSRNQHLVEMSFYMIHKKCFKSSHINNKKSCMSRKAFNQCTRNQSHTPLAIRLKKGRDTGKVSLSIESSNLDIAEWSMTVLMQTHSLLLVRNRKTICKIKSREMIHLIIRKKEDNTLGRMYSRMIAINFFRVISLKAVKSSLLGRELSGGSQRQD